MAEESPRDSTAPKEGEINWQEFNYPPLIKLIHFRPSEAAEEYRGTVWMLFATHMIIFTEGWLNLVNNSVQVSAGASGLRILYSFLFMLIFNPLATFLMYRGYAGICRDKSYLSIFMYLQPLAVILWLTFSIVNFLGFNGFIRVASLYSGGYSGAGTLSLIESLLLMGNALLGSYLYYKIWVIRGSLASKLAPRLL